MVGRGRGRGGRSVWIPAKEGVVGKISIKRDKIKPPTTTTTFVTKAIGKRCGNCRNKKRGCDRKTPCNTCVRRGESNSCEPFDSLSRSTSTSAEPEEDVEMDQLQGYRETASSPLFTTEQ